MMPQERRISTRKTLDHLVYLSLPFNNGGTVIDVSEGGLGFHSVAPVVADGPIHFRFAIDSAIRIRAVGELAWIDATGKIGGLRFTQLPDEVREQLHHWADQSHAMAKASIADSLIAEWGIEAEVTPGGKANLARVLTTRSPLLYNLKPPIYSAPFYKLSMFPLEPDLEAVATPSAVLRSAAIRHPSVVIGLTIVLAFLATMGIIAYVTTSRTAEVLFVWGEKMWSGF
jgi:PilZ domain